jgi:hypothetical protein
MRFITKSSSTRPTASSRVTPAKRLTWDIGFSYYPALAVDASGRVHVVWQDNTPGNYEIYYRRFVK